MIGASHKPSGIDAIFAFAEALGKDWLDRRLTENIILRVLEGGPSFRIGLEAEVLKRLMEPGSVVKRRRSSTVSYAGRDIAVLRRTDLFMDNRSVEIDGCDHVAIADHFTATEIANLTLLIGLIEM
jgi:hypothetical protein